MNALDLMQSLQDQPFATAIAESPWLFPFFETIHVLALTLVVGSVAMMDFRLLGFVNRNRAITSFTASILPWTWSAFAVAAATGLLMFCSKAAAYYMDIPFRIKVVCLVFAAVNMLIFRLARAPPPTAWITPHSQLRWTTERAGSGATARAFQVLWSLLVCHRLDHIFIMR